jgi:hypothetical protein
LSFAALIQIPVFPTNKAATYPWGPYLLGEVFHLNKVISGENTGGYAQNALSVSIPKWIVKQHARQKCLEASTIRAMTKNKQPLQYFAVTIILIALLALLGPEEKSLGSNVRIVYLHGAWVLASEAAFIAAGLAGLLGLVMRKDIFHAWSAALGRTGIIFWLTYLPLSLFAMQANWNGLFLAEPRFRLATIFAVTGTLLQVGLWLFNTSWLTSLANLLYIIALRVIFAMAQNIMHPPPSPIFNSGNYVIIGFFISLNLLSWLAAYFLTRIFLTFKSNN